MENIENVIKWAKEKDLLKKENSAMQMCKVLKGNQNDLKDGMGDTIVTLIILAAQNDLTIQECLDAAWSEIKDRKGKTVNGTFIKN